MAIFFFFFFWIDILIFMQMFTYFKLHFCVLNLYYRFLTYNLNENENYENEREFFSPNILKTFSTI